MCDDFKLSLKIIRNIYKLLINIDICVINIKSNKYKQNGVVE